MAPYGPTEDEVPLVSVVLPAFNAGQFIETAIRSVLAQSHPRVELILVDDGSEDDTLAVMRRYEGQAVVVAHGNNRGGNAARNTGVDRSTGSLIAFLDGDDHWEPQKVATFVQGLETHSEPQFAFSDFNRFEWDTGLYYSHSNSQLHPQIYDAIRSMKYRDLRAFVIPRDQMLRLLLLGYPPFSSTIVVRRRIFDDVGPWDESLRRNQDFEFALRCCLATDFLYLDERLTSIGRHATNVSSDIDAQRNGDLAVMRKFMGNASFDREEQRRIAHYVGVRLAKRGAELREDGRSKEAIRWYLEAVRYPGMLWHATVRLVYTALRSLSPGTAQRRR